MLVLPLPAEEVTRNADPDGLLEDGGGGGGARPQRTRDQALEEGREEGRWTVRGHLRDSRTPGRKERREEEIPTFILLHFQFKNQQTPIKTNNKIREEEPERWSLILRSSD